MDKITYDAELLKKFPINTYVKWNVWTAGRGDVGVVK